MTSIPWSENNLYSYLVQSYWDTHWTDDELSSSQYQSLESFSKRLGTFAPYCTYGNKIISPSTTASTSTSNIHHVDIVHHDKAHDRYIVNMMTDRLVNDQSNKNAYFSFPTEYFTIFISIFFLVSIIIIVIIVWMTYSCYHPRRRNLKYILSCIYYKYINSKNMNNQNNHFNDNNNEYNNKELVSGLSDSKFDEKFKFMNYSNNSCIRNNNGNSNIVNSKSNNVEVDKDKDNNYYKEYSNLHSRIRSPKYPSALLL